MRKNYKHMPNVIFGDFMLRTITIKDYRDMFDYGKDVEVTKYLTWGPFKKPVEAKKAIKNVFYPRVKRGLPRGYAIMDLKLNKMIGTIDFHSKKKGENGAEIGYVIHKDYWNQGIMTKALHEIIHIGFDYLDYDIIHIKHMKQNVQSQKVIERNLFVKVNIEPFTYQKNGQLITDDLYIYELTKERYNANQQS
ncbi:MAG: GNAT family N-acetyltransferase [Acholeplasmataceae bacterium]|jgi:ribosomal-protein-alanine N-acetyltransferase|nr:GNAT family N-acetyltransferase [Acholeplasmataceae bacterium]